MNVLYIVKSVINQSACMKQFELSQSSDILLSQNCTKGMTDPTVKVLKTTVNTMVMMQGS